MTDINSNLVYALRSNRKHRIVICFKGDNFIRGIRRDTKRYTSVEIPAADFHRLYIATDEMVE